MTRARNSANLASHGNLFVDIANDRTGIGSVVPAQNLHVAGTAGFHADTTFTGDLYNTVWDRSANTLQVKANAILKIGQGSYSCDIRTDGVNLNIDHNAISGFFVKTTDLQITGSGNRSGTTYDGTIFRARTGIVELGHEIGNGGATGFKLATTAYGVNVTGTTDTDGLVVSGVATVATMNVTGVLTYDDVTSVDSVGIITARQGVRVPDGSVSANYISAGNSQDLKIYHDGSHSFIRDTGTGGLRITTDSFNVLNSVNNEAMITATEDGAVKLYYDHNLRLETQTSRTIFRGSGGIGVYGEVGQNHNGQISIHPTGNAVYANLLFYNAAGNSYASIVGHAGGTLFFTGGTNSPLRHRVSGTGFHSFQEGNTERVRITVSGEVNIGGNLTQTTVPLCVTTGANDFGIRLMTGSNVVCEILNNDSAGNSEIRGYYNNNSGTRGEGYRLEANGETFFSPGGNSGLNITSNGNVVVSQTLFITDAIQHHGDNDTRIRFPADDKVKIELGGTTAFSGLKSTSGAAHAKWGINVATPQAALHIDEAYNHQGVLRVTNGNQNSGYYHQLEMSGTQNIYTLWKHYDGSNYYNSHLHGSTRHAWYISGNEKLRIDSNGTVLHGSGAIATQKASNGGFDISCNSHSLVIGADSGGGSIVQTRTNSTNKDGRIGHVHYTNAEEPIGIVRVHASSSENVVYFGGGSSLFNAATSLQFFTAGTNTTTSGSERLRIRSDGNIGIGNNVADANWKVKLVVPDNASYQNALNITNNQNSDFNVVIKSNVTAIGNGTNNPLAFFTNGNSNERLRITSGGNLKLPDGGEIQFGGALGSGNGDLRIHHDGSDSNIWDTGTGNLNINATSLNFNNNDLGGRYIECASNSHVKLYFAGSEKLATTNTGVSVTGAVNPSGNLAFTSNNCQIQTGSSGHMVAIQGGATNMGGRIEFRGGNSTGDIRMYAQGATSTQEERLRITSSGQLQHRSGSGVSYFKGASEYIFGSEYSSPPAGGPEAGFQVHANKSRATVSVNGYFNNAGAPILQFVSSRSGTTGVLGTKAQSNDYHGDIRFFGDNGTNNNSLVQSAQILARQKSTISDGDTVCAGEVSFYTGTDSAGSMLERLRIDSGGRLTLLNSEGIKLSIKTSTLYAQDGTISYYATNNGVYLNGAGADGWLRLNASGVSNDRTSINLTGHTATNGDSIHFRTNSTERMRIFNDGHVQISGAAGTTAGNLHVGVNGATGNFTDSGNGNTKHIEIGATSGGDALLTTHASGYGVAYFGYEAGGDRCVVACDDGGGNNKIDFITNAGTTTGGTGDNLNGKHPKMRIKSGGGGVQIFVHESVSDFQPKHDVTALLIQNGIGGGDIGGTSEPTHIDWAWVDSNANDRPQCRISGNVGDGGDPNSLQKEGKGFLTFHCSDTNSSSTNDIDPPQRLRIAHNGTFTGSSSNNISDQRLKENIATITDPITKIKALKGRTFTWKSEARMREGTHYGFIAQEVESIIPDLIVDDTGIRVFDKDDNLQPSNVITPPVGGGYAKSVTADGVTPVLVEALKEALTRIETLEAEVAALKSA